MRNWPVFWIFWISKISWYSKRLTNSKISPDDDIIYFCAFSCLLLTRIPFWRLSCLSANEMCQIFVEQSSDDVSTAWSQTLMILVIRSGWHWSTFISTQLKSVSTFTLFNCFSISRSWFFVVLRSFFFSPFESLKLKMQDSICVSNILSKAIL